MHHGIVKDIPVQQRITIKSLDTLLQQELLDKGITTSCAYGVYSTKDDDFVMLNPVAKDCEERYLQPSDFKYSISLFPSSNEQVARLYVDFPYKEAFCGVVYGCI